MTAVGLLAVVIILVSLKAAQIGSLIAFGKKAEAAGPPPEAVGIARADEQAWEGTISAVGTIAPARGVNVSNEAPGTVTRIAFESGAVIKEGQTLVELDTSVERAQLASLVSRRELATTTVGRSRALVAKGSISQAQADADENVLQTANADAATIQAQISRKTVRAPFTGRLGIRQVNVGQYLNPGTPITVLESLDKLFVDFTLPQQRLADVAVGMAVRLDLDNAKGPPIDGVISAVDPTVDGGTRTIKLRATIPTASDRLRSGMFVTVSVVRPEKQKYVTVPASAVFHAPYGDSVFVVEPRKPDAPGSPTMPDGKPVKNARQQFVKLGESRGDFVVVLDGLKAGQDVVSSGAFKLRNNAPVFVGDVPGPAPTLEPHPQNR